MSFTTCSKIITKLVAVLITMSMSYAIVRFSVGGQSSLPVFGFAIVSIVIGMFHVGLFFSEEAIKSKSKTTIIVFFLMLPALVFFSVLTLEGIRIFFYRGMFRDVYYFMSFSVFIYLVQAIRLAKAIIKMTMKDLRS